eukprot:346798_1
MNVKLSSSDFEVVERILNDHNGGEFFEPAYPNKESKSLQQVTKHLFRFGVPTKYVDPTNYISDKNKSEQEILIKNLQLAFYAKKRISHATNLINKIPKTQQTTFLNAFSVNHEITESS